MQFSVVIPVFNKADLTRKCLQSLERTLDRSAGEVILVDNASSDETPAVLAEFPWVKRIRNEQNLGFAGATNQGARIAGGEFLVLLNNDIVAHDGWLAALLECARETGAGAVGAKLLFPSGALQHAGVVISPNRLSPAQFMPVHAYYGSAQDFAAANVRREYQAVTAACMLTPRELFLELGGLDEAYWNGYEDMDYCFRVRARGRRIMYEPRAVLTHFESQSGPERFRKASWNVALLAKRWNGTVQYDQNASLIEAGYVGRTLRRGHGSAQLECITIPPVTVLVHGDTGQPLPETLHANRVSIARVIECEDGDAVSAARAEMEHRGDRYLAFVARAAVLEGGWLDELVRQVQFSPACAAATFAPQAAPGEDVVVFAADARCTLLHLMNLPAHVRLDRFDTLDGALADLLIRCTPLRLAARGAARRIASLPALKPDAAFERVHGLSVAGAPAAAGLHAEDALRTTAAAERGLVSIVMLSWNAPQFTKMALESIHTHTAGAFEVIVVDNGSQAETVDWLRSLEGTPLGANLRVIYNSENRGFAGGNNQALAQARGQYVVLLNNDVIVTDGWLDGLLGAFDRIPRLGVSAPRSNKIAGDQMIADAQYDSLDAMHEYARARRERYRDRGYVTDRAIGLCLCIDRRVIDEVGGIDERFGVGNFEDDDFCLRVRAAGYTIYVCDDVFIHHFGSQTFAANKVDWTATMRENWTKFAEKWQLPPKQENGGYQPLPAIRRGFVRERHYVALPGSQVAQDSEREYRVVFAAAVRTEDDWPEVAAFVRRYLRAFDAQAPVLLSIGVFDGMNAQSLGARARRIAEKLGLDAQSCADVDISDESDERAWRGALPGEMQVDVGEIRERSPSALRRYAAGTPA